MIDAYYFSAEWTELRRQVRARDGSRCRYCGDHGVQADHVVPRSKGGADHLDNLVCCCPTCNKIAGGRAFKTIAAKRRYILKHRARRVQSRRKFGAKLKFWARKKGVR